MTRSTPGRLGAMPQIPGFTWPALAMLAGMILLAGCSGFSNRQTWTKAGVTDDKARTDIATCEAQAAAQTKRDRDIDHDIADTAGSSQGEDTPLTNLKDYTNATNDRGDVRDCMQGMGYSEVK